MGGGGSGSTSEESKSTSFDGLEPGAVLSTNLKEIPIYIDGVKYNSNAKKIVIKRFKKDNIQTSIPLVSFLPLKQDNLTNSSF